MHAVLEFCSYCGDRLELRYVQEEEHDRLVCVSCSTIHYVNPKIVAGAIPEVGRRVWLLRRAIEPRLGYWTFPAGFMEMNESVEEAATRETREELSLQVRVDRLLGVYSRPEAATVHIVYVGTALSEPMGGRETLEFALFAPEEIPWHDLAFWSTHQALADWVASLDS